MRAHTYFKFYCRCVISIRGVWNAEIGKQNVKMYLSKVKPWENSFPYSTHPDANQVQPRVYLHEGREEKKTHSLKRFSLMNFVGINCRKNVEQWKRNQLPPTLGHSRRRRRSDLEAFRNLRDSRQLMSVAHERLRNCEVFGKLSVVWVPSVWHSSEIGKFDRKATWRGKHGTSLDWVFKLLPQKGLQNEKKIINLQTIEEELRRFYLGNTISRPEERKGRHYCFICSRYHAEKATGSTLLFVSSNSFQHEYDSLPSLSLRKFAKRATSNFLFAHKWGFVLRKNGDHDWRVIADGKIFAELSVRQFVGWLVKDELMETIPGVVICDFNGFCER